MAYCRHGWRSSDFRLRRADGGVVAEPPYDDDAPDLDYVTEYGAAIAPEDKVSSKDDHLTMIAAILQQDRFNVQVNGLRQQGDSADTYFADKKHRLGKADAILKIDKETTAAIIDRNPSLLATIYSRKSTGRLEISAGISDGSPADEPDATETPRPLHEIPEEYRGRWAYSAQHCKVGEPTAILRIDAEGLHQAEGEMIALAVLAMSGERRAIAINAHNSGGGGEWDSTEEFVLSSDGNILEWRMRPPYPAAPSRLYRCRRSGS